MNKEQATLRKRYLVFSFVTHYIREGVWDLVGTFATISEVFGFIKRDDNNHYSVYDRIQRVEIDCSKLDL
jgi:hypothetical protein